MQYLCGMKHRIIHIALLLTSVCNLAAQTIISGMVKSGQEPLAGANVFIMGTIDGCLTDSLGSFSFSTSKTGEASIKITMIGFEEYMQTTDACKLHNLSIQMKEKATAIQEVVISASTYSFGKSDNFKTMDALDVVMAGNSCGDIVAALQTLPGTQKVGENGKLYVRGGESEECQTFINGMHVLVPYSTNTENTAVRGRFSPFIFKGINFSLGGYSGEYGQALSSVLPMETSDAATSDKYGVSASLVDWNIGGTKAYSHSSLSFNAALTSLGIYNQLFSERLDFNKPYLKLSGESQYKNEFRNAGILKTYVGYDFTSVGQHIDNQNLSLKENNIYANTTYKAQWGAGYTLFCGMASSSVFNDIEDAKIAGDRYYNFRNEIHLKTGIRKICSDALKISAGMEDYQRNSLMEYENDCYKLDYNILAAHIDAQWRMMPHLFLNISTRTEYMAHANWLFMPRATLCYIPNKNFQLSFATGRYSQTPEDDYLATNKKSLGQSTADHAILSIQYKSPGTLIRIEPYWKKYQRLPLWEKGIYQPKGYGKSKGIDIFVEEHSLFKHLTTAFSYSYNDSKRFYHEYTEERIPDYASRHNLRLTAKYSFGKAIIGLTESYASGRHFLIGKTPHYNSVDINLTYLLRPKVIIYSSLNNILGRTNIFGYNTNGRSIVPSRDRFLYIGIFVSLKNNKAYDISNF